MKEIRIGVIPIDDRPCNLSFLSEAIGENQAVQVDLPPSESLGHFERAGNLELLKEYLIANCLNWDYLILSLDALCYGGLVQARKFSGELDMEFYFEQLSLIKTLKKINPHLKIFSYSVIIRLTTTVTESIHLKSWEQIFDYSKLAYLAETDEASKKKLAQLEKEIDQYILTQYLNARKRNHVINLIAIDYSKLGLIDHLSIIQEDAQVEGIHLTEQHGIQNKINDLDLTEKIKIKNGTDELVTLLGARIINETYGKTRVYLETNQLRHDYVAKYEDRPLLENLKLIFKEAGIELVEKPEKANVVCFVLNQPNLQLDYVFETKEVKSIHKDNLYQVSSLAKNKPFVVLDLQHVNGGSIDDLQLFIELNGLSVNQLVGYSAWNTSSNSIGTIALDCTLGKHGLNQIAYLENRLIDDALYQGRVRDEVNDLINESADNVWYFKKSDNNYTTYLNTRIKEEILNYPEFFKGKKERKIRFPWNRTFEIEIKEEQH